MKPKTMIRHDDEFEKTSKKKAKRNAKKREDVAKENAQEAVKKLRVGWDRLEILTQHAAPPAAPEKEDVVMEQAEEKSGDPMNVSVDDMICLLEQED